ncbi:MAG TPA: polymer-forming cytoskeletal protein [Actinomycetota bacterium]|jgi:hypothetical protein|nr:polymer-forming cytoskeletal protein [Actinomycetota bacterium]
MRRILLYFLLPAAALLSAAPALAADEATADGDGSLVVITGGAHLESDRTVDTVVVFDGETVIDGSVLGTVVVFNGPTTISGSVDGDVIVFRGRLTLADGAVVTGNVFAQRRTIAAGARVDGDISGVGRLTWGLRWAGWIAAIAVWFAIAVSVLVLGLLMLWLAPRGMEAVLASARTALAASIGWGFGLFVGLPILAVLAIATLVGIPLGVGVLLALALIFAIGQTTAAFLLGRTILGPPRSRIVSFLAGWAILAAIALIPGVGGLIWFAGTVFGLGAIAVAMWRARGQPTAPLVPPPPA